MARKLLLAALLVLSVVAYAQADHGRSDSEDSGDGSREKRIVFLVSAKVAIIKAAILKSGPLQRLFFKVAKVSIKHASKRQIRRFYNSHKRAVERAIKRAGRSLWRKFKSTPRKIWGQIKGFFGG